MDLDNNRKMHVEIDRETGSDEMLAVLDKLNFDLEESFDNLIKKSEFVLE